MDRRDDSARQRQKAPSSRGKNGHAVRAAAAYAAGASVSAASALVAWFVFGRAQLADAAMVFLLGVTVVSMRFGYGPSLVAAVLSAVSFEFLFLPPYFSFAIAGAGHAVTFAVMFFVAFVVSHLTKRIRDQADAARERERRTASLYALSREIGLAHSREALVESAARHVGEVFGSDVAILLPDASGVLQPTLATPEVREACASEMGTAERAWRGGRLVGASADTFGSERALCVPLTGSRGCVGVLSLFSKEKARLQNKDERDLLGTFAGLVGSALERTELADEARLAALRIETEQLRNALLSSVSHDLTTPLGIITGAASTLLDDNGPADERSRRRLLETAHEEALRLHRLVRNLLDMTRLEAGALAVRREPQSVEEVVGAALARLEDRLHGRDVQTNIPEDLPVFQFDPVLLEQVLINLVDNAIKYTPQGSPIELSARVCDAFVEIEVADRGPGVRAHDSSRIFDKFCRLHEREGGGVGLGLTICRGIVHAHGGRIWVDERLGGGSSFRFTLPLEATFNQSLVAHEATPEPEAR